MPPGFTIFIIIMPKIITTSWDDGHPKDFVISELLDKYNLKGTFYIPRANPENIVLSEDQLLSLSKNNEIGGHTLNHVRLTGQSIKTVQAEVSGCYKWLKEILHIDPVSFCFPRGSYSPKVIDCVKQAGFKIARTTDLLSVLPNTFNNLMPTTIQVYEHNSATYFKHLMKRFKFNNMLIWMKSASGSDILKLTDYYIGHILKHDGCFHLWGHSWEIEKFGLWSKLELIFKHISGLPDFKYVWNKDVLDSYITQPMLV